jgi:amidase
MERSGFVVLGKTNTPEFGLLPTTEPYLFGPANNPWNLAYSPGGSSGGSAAAVAAGIVPIAQASDGGGSIRVPACNCGLFGIKATRNRFPRAGAAKRGGQLAVRGFVSRSVRDGKAAFDFVALKAEEGSLLPLPVYPDTEPLRRLRIAFSTRDLRGQEAHPECVKAVRKTAELCERLGHAVEEDAPPVDGVAFNEHFLTFWSEGATARIASVAAQIGREPPQDAFEPWTWGLRDLFAKRPDDAVARAERHMAIVTGQLAAFHQRYEVWLTPVLGTPPLRTGEATQEQPFDDLVAQLTRYVAFTPLANATGQPAMSVPLHWTEDGLPVGSHFLARPGEDALLFALAEQLEAAQPWTDRWPPTSIALL